MGKTKPTVLFENPIYQQIVFQEFNPLPKIPKKIPSDSEVLEKFNVIVNDLDARPERRKWFDSRTIQQKWELYCDILNEDSNTPSPEYLVLCIQMLPSTEVLSCLAKYLNKGRISFMQRLMAVNGHKLLLNLLSEYTKSFANSTNVIPCDVVSGALNCLRTIVNTKRGSAAIIAYQDAIPIIVCAMSSKVAHSYENAIAILLLFLFSDSPNVDNLKNLKTTFKAIELLDGGWASFAHEIAIRPDRQLIISLSTFIKGVLFYLSNRHRMRIEFSLTMVESGIYKALLDLKTDPSDPIGEAIETIINKISQDIQTIASLFIEPHVNPFSIRSMSKYLKGSSWPSQLFVSIMLSLTDISINYEKSRSSIFTFLHNFLVVQRYFLSQKDDKKMSYSISIALNAPHIIKIPLTCSSNVKSHAHEELWEHSFFVADKELSTVELAQFLVSSSEELNSNNSENTKSNEMEIMTGKEVQEKLSAIQLEYEDKIQSLQSQIDALKQTCKSALESRDKETQRSSDLDLRTKQLENIEKDLQSKLSKIEQQCQKSKDDYLVKKSADESRIQELQESLLNMEIQSKKNIAELNATKQEEVSSLNTIINENNEKILSFENEINALQAQNKGMNSEKISLIKKLKELEKKNNDCELMINDKDTSIETNMRIINQQNNEISVLKAQLSEFRSQINEMTLSLDTEISSKKHEYEKIQIQLADELKRNKELEQSKKALHSDLLKEMQSLEQSKNIEIESLSLENKTLSLKLIELEKLKQNLENQIELSIESAEAKYKLKQKEFENNISSLTNQLETEKRLSLDLQMQIRAIQDSASDEKNSIMSTLTHEIEPLRAQIRNQADTILSLRNESESMKTKYEEQIKISNEKHIKSINEIKKSKEDTEKELTIGFEQEKQIIESRYEQEIQQLSLDFKNKINNLMSEITALKSANEVLMESTIKSLNESHENEIKSINIQYNQKLEQMKIEFQTQEETILSRSQVENSQLNSYNKTLEHKIKQYESDNNEMKNVHSQLAISFENLKNQHSVTLLDLKNAKAQFEQQSLLMGNEITQRDTKVSDLANQVKALSISNSQINEDLNRKEIIIKEQTQEMTNLRNLYQKKENEFLFEIGKAKDLLKSAKQEHSDREAELNHSIDELMKKGNESNSEINQQIELLRRKNNDLQSQNTIQKSQIEELMSFKEDYQTARNELEQAQSDLLQFQNQRVSYEQASLVMDKRVSELEQTISLKDSELLSLKEKDNNLLMQYNQTLESICKLKQENDSFAKLNTSLQSQISLYESSIHNIELQLAEKSRNTESLMDENIRRKTENETLHEEIKSLKFEKSEAVKNIKDFEKGNSQLLIQLQDRENILAKQTTELSQLSHQLKGTITEKDILTKLIDDLKSNISNTEVEHSKLQKLIEENNEQNKSLKIENEKIKLSNNNLGEQIALLNNTIKNNSELFSHREAELLATLTNLSQTNDADEKLNETLKELQEVQKKNNEKEVTICELKKAIESLQNTSLELDSMCKQYKDLNIQMDEKNSEISHLKEKISSRNNELLKIREDLNSKTVQLSSLQDMLHDHESIKSQLTQKDNQVSLKDEEIKKMEKANRDIKNQNDLLNKEVNDLRLSLSSIEKDNFALKESFKASNSQNIEMKDRLQTDLERAKSEIDTLNAECERLGNVCSQNQIDFKESTKKNEELISAIKKENIDQRIAISSLQSELDSSKSSINLLNIKLNSIEKQNESYCSKIESSSSLEKQLNETIDSQNQEIENLQKEVQELKLSLLKIPTQQEENPENEEDLSPKDPLPPKDNQPPPFQTKKLLWSPLDNQIASQTIWAQIPSCAIDESEIATFFRSESAIDIIDSTKLKNISIFLSQIKRSIPDILNGIKQISEWFTEDQIISLKSFIPSNEEVSALHSVSSSGVQIGPAEQLLYGLSTISFLAERLDFMLLTKTFPRFAQKYETELISLHIGFTQLKASQRLRTILSMVLSIGNYLNGGTSYGGASGFTLDSLAILKKTPTNNPSLTFIQFLAIHISKKSQDLLRFVEDFPDLLSNSSLNMEYVQQTLKDASDTLMSAMMQVPLAESKVVEGDLFFPKFMEFYGDNRSRVDQLNETFQTILKDFKASIRIFAENNKSISLPDFIGKFVSFSDDLKRAHFDVISMAPQTPVNNNTTSMPGQTPDTERGVLDNLMQNIQTGNSLFGKKEEKKKEEKVQPKKNSFLSFWGK